MVQLGTKGPDMTCKFALPLFPFLPPQALFPLPPPSYAHQTNPTSHREPHSPSHLDNHRTRRPDHHRLPPRPARPLPQVHGRPPPKGQISRSSSSAQSGVDFTSQWILWRPHQHPRLIHLWFWHSGFVDYQGSCCSRRSCRERCLCLGISCFDLLGLAGVFV